MVDFRRCITALAVLALFTGLAVAQINTQPLSCATNVSVTPTLRGEGFTEQTGDITLICTGGNTPAVGAAIPLINITVFYNTTVTSRLLPSSTLSGNISEALLLIDDPGSALTPVVTGFGPAAGQNVCANPTTGCIEYVGTQPSIIGGLATPVAVDAIGGTTAGKNVFQGVVNGNSVTFFGVPVLAPGTVNSRVFRISNVRVNANPLGGGSTSGASPVQASISISGATSVGITQPSQVVGFVTNGLSASLSSTSRAFNQCSTQTRTDISTIRFTENFGTAFKTRVNPPTNSTYAGQATSTTQNVPGAIYNSESNLIIPIPAGSGVSTQTAGLADFGTRLKATFNNIPAGARIFVSTANVNNSVTVLTNVPSPIGGTSIFSYAQLVSGESAGDGGSTQTGIFPLVSNGPDAGPAGIPIAEIQLTNGSGQAVWEVVNTNPNAIETFAFGVYVSYGANVATNSPTPGQSTVSLGFAPSPPSFRASDGANASSSLTIPRFVADSSAARNLFLIQICRTILLYPFVTNQAGFDTGIAIANTSQDPFTTGGNTTAAQAGTCSLNWYGGTSVAPTTPPAASTVASIAGGTVYVNTAGILVPTFQGYMIAVCNFQYAHGFAFISDVGARNLAMGYLAVVLGDPGTGSRTPGQTFNAENGAH